LYEISLVAIPADTGAAVVERSAPHRSGFAFSALRAVPPAAIQRAVAGIRPNRGQIMNDACHVWSLLEARERDRREFRVWVKREIERRRATAPG
jgi:hypothetical protein